MITLSPFIHRGEKKIRIDFERNSGAYAAIRKLSEVKYTKTHGCWYIDYDPIPYNALKAIGLSISVSCGNVQFGMDNDKDTLCQNDIYRQPPSFVSVIETSTSKCIANRSDYHRDIIISYYNQRFYITIPYVLSDVNFIKSLNGSYWDMHQKKWIVRANPVHLKALQEYFVYWQNDDYDKILDMVHTAIDPMIIELYTTPEYPQHFVVKLKGYRPDYSFLKTISGRNYDDALRRWVLPLSPDLAERVINHYNQLNARIINRLPVADETYYKQTISNLQKQTALINKFPSVQHDVLKKYTNTLIRQTYSWSTVTAYIGPFFRYTVYIQPIHIDQSGATHVNDFLAEMASKNTSDSVLNTAINAIKFYFEKVAFRADFKIEQIKRPRKGRYLPTILSISEVDRILRGTENVKHATILYTFYGSGIRLNELLSLKVNDVWWDRNQLLVKHGKGGKDRIVMLSETLKQLLKKYFDEYMPQYWLFEGQDKQHKYSEKSVQQVVKQAASRVGITKKVTPHTLRHCFATHLMDGGVQLPYIQELLGHKDVKTTMIYTHVTTKNVTSVVSPLDQLRMV